MRLRGLPFRPTLIALVLSVLALGTGGVSLSSYTSGKHLADLLWTDLSEHLAREAVQKTMRFLDPAVPALAETRGQVALGALDVSDDQAVLRHLRASLDAHPSFTWTSFGRADNTFFTVNHAEGQLSTEIRRNPTDGGPTLVESYAWEGRALKLQGTAPSDYQTVTRPWYVAAQGDEGGHWGKPYLFFSNKHPGVIYSRSQHEGPDGGALQGVWTVDFELSQVDQFLAGMKVVSRGRVYIITAAGDAVGVPGGHHVVGEGKALHLGRVDEQEDPLLTQAYAAWKAAGFGAQRLHVGDHLAVVRPFPAPTGMPYVVLVTVPEEVIFGEVDAQLKRDLFIAALTLAVALFFGVLMSNRVSVALVDLSAAMAQVGRFDLGERPVLADQSRVREVNAMAQAFLAMKASLRSFARYVPYQVVSDLLRSGQEATLGGRKQPLSVLFCDIAGFTSISERMEPDALVASLGVFLQMTSGAVMEQGGTVDKFIGDAVMAFWNAPQPYEDHALRACLAALEVQRRTNALAAKYAAEGKPPFHARIGINTGVAVVGNIGAPDRLNYTALGDAVNVASRLEGLNKSYGTRLMIGEATALLVKDKLELRLLDWVAVKGRDQAMAVYELLGEKGKVEPVRRALGLRYETALADYRARRFLDAANTFETLALQGDEPAALLARRCRAFLDAPPPADWSGAHVMDTK